VLSNHKSEVEQIVDVCDWAAHTFGTEVLLLGSSAGAPQAGSALDKRNCVVGLACVGYTFGWIASIGFGRHFASLLRSKKPRLLIMGDQDEVRSLRPSPCAQPPTQSHCNPHTRQGTHHHPTLPLLWECSSRRSRNCRSSFAGRATVRARASSFRVSDILSSSLVRTMGVLRTAC
jgi:hypothetical protein